MEDKKLLFGLTPKGALIHGILMGMLHSFSWAVRIWQQVSFDEFKKLNRDQTHDLVEWYFFWPTLILSMWLLSGYFDNKYSKGKHVFIKRLIMSISLFTIVVFTTKVIFLGTLYQLFN